MSDLTFSESKLQEIRDRLILEIKHANYEDCHFVEVALSFYRAHLRRKGHGLREADE